MTDRKLLRSASFLLFAGLLLTILVGIFHTDRAAANDHAAAFTDYANSGIWTAVHFGQFLAMMVLITGLLLLYFSFNLRSVGAGWAGRFGSISAVVTLALYGVLQAVDGVALKQAVNAWLNAPEAEKAARFASAEAIRWLEWGMRSYFSFMLGLSFILFAVMIVSYGRAPRAVGYLMGLTGLAYFVQGWVIGSEGFSANNTIPTLLGYFSWLIWSLWLLVFAWRMSATPGVLPDQSATAEMV
jgi:hypothetical protein